MMIDSDGKEIIPDWAVSPGTILEECIRELKMSPKKLARIMGVDYKWVKNLIKGREEITPEIAKNLCQATGVKEYFWVRSEWLYRKRLKGESVSDEQWAKDIEKIINTWRQSCSNNSETK